jgi:hypothetical protein
MHYYGTTVKNWGGVGGGGRGWEGEGGGYGTSQLFPQLFDQVAVTVFPTGRFFGRITEKGPSKNVSGRSNLWQNFGRIFPEMAEKGPNITNVLFLVFFPYETSKI